MEIPAPGRCRTPGTPRPPEGRLLPETRNAKLETGNAPSFPGNVPFFPGLAYNGDAMQIPEEDLVFGDLVVSQGLCSRERVEECLALLRNLAGEGAESLPRLGEMLVQKGYLSPLTGVPTVVVPPPTIRDPDALPRPAAVAARTPANVIGRYIRVSHIGEGGMGEVWRAWDQDLRRWVAMKFLKSVDPQEIARFQREAHTAAKLNHPNLVAVYDVGSHEGRLFLAMQFIDGPTLGSLPKSRLRLHVELVRDAALALQYAHDHGIVHRDIKPHNLMVEGLDRKPRVYVMDFGLAKPTTSDVAISASGTVVGTPAYMPPEQAIGGYGVGPRSDVYSLGATLFHVLTGHAPFQDSVVYDLLRKVVEDEPPPIRELNPEIDADLAAVIRKCLEKLPDDRYASAQALADDLGRWLAGDPVQASRPTLVRRIVRRIRKRKALFSTLSAAIAGLVFLGLFTAYRWRASSRVQSRERSLERARLHVEGGRRRIEEMRVHQTREGYRPQDLEDLSHQAVAEFEKALLEVPDHPEALLGISRAHALSGRRDLALSFIERTLAAAPTYGPAYLDRVRLRIDAYERLRHGSDEGVRPDTDESLALRRSLEADLANARRYAGDSAERLYAEGLLAFCEGDWSKAEGFFREYLSHMPADGRAQYWHGHALVHLGRHDEAEEALTRAVSCNTRDADAGFFRALARAKKNDLRGAIKDFTRVLEIRPEWTDALRNRSVVYLRLKEYDPAIRDLEEILRREPAARPAHLADACYNRALLRHAKRDFDGAVSDCTRAVEAEPKHALAFRLRGLAHLDSGRVDPAIADLTTAVTLRPDFAQAFNERGIAYAQKNDLDSALRDWEEAIRLNPRDPEAYGNRGRARSMRGDRAGAIADYRKALELAPPDWPNRRMTQQRLDELVN